MAAKTKKKNMDSYHLLRRIHDSCHGGQWVVQRNFAQQQTSVRGLQAGESRILVIDAEYLYFSTAEESWIAYAPSIGDCDDYATRHGEDWWYHWCQDMTSVAYEDLPDRTKEEIKKLQELDLLPDGL